ncbi:two-component system, sensor histidine kinase YesM [Butyrivibrio fibrisolvens DSM 3071]|jgi:two-component system sensor histidine kinase YesM|uniref:histidine kinase n=1 Tax=Butyrivibrio fibrisolvens DSM 3071 TaxID=1121131 RepID=A0A1M5V1N6_BUTFI|nr:MULTISPECIES: sensor histidine kinase [Butyrivibrio]SHH69018.1 two-component system, sensor histidine kinase YesM [Butyrivibrio fibrisolvens DSM 3071]
MGIFKGRDSRIKKGHHELKRKLGARNIQITLLTSYTVVSILSMSLLGAVLYRSFASISRQVATENARTILSQTGEKLEDYLRQMRQLSDAFYYTSIQTSDIYVDKIGSQMNLLYESNKDYVVSMALFESNGRLLGAAPSAIQKKNIDVTTQEWFTDATGEVENMHFSTPHVQNLFSDSSNRYYWVISLSRSVMFTRGGIPKQGVLLVDMDYTTVYQMFDILNNSLSQGYIYLCDREGRIIYHPQNMQIVSGLYEENNTTVASYSDGVYEEKFNGEKRIEIVNTISYTGWKLISVIPTKNLSVGLRSTRSFMILIVLLVMLAVLLLNRLISARISSPIRKLTASIHDIEVTEKSVPLVYIGGSSEVQYLGSTLQKLLNQISFLMGDIIKEQEEKRKSELDALQSQVNPHFLYNTLDSIVWMVEDGRNKEAVYMITQLSSLFRISLSSGRNIIRVSEEIKHAENYTNIQKVRFKDSFSVSYDIDPEIMDCCIVKLVVQPLLENAIYYGVKGMEDPGSIKVRGYRKEDEVYIEVEDNGYGMSPEQAEGLLTEEGRTRARGSGVGLINVHRRLQLRFGKDYGLMIDTEADEGTKVTIHMPYIEYSEESAKDVESAEYI